MASRVRMSEAHWGALSAFDWADRARAAWKQLGESDRRAVYNSAKAEIAASVAHNRAAARIEKAYGRGVTP